jgi:hypothetical protein
MTVSSGRILPVGQTLSPGQTLSAPIRISARETWTDTTVEMAPGEEYELSADGLWVDFYIPSSPNGFFFLPERLVKRFLRHPPANFFALIGSLNRSPNQQFFIGEQCKYKAEVAGRLFCFANDVPGFYWNNWGNVDLTIKRIL